MRKVLLALLFLPSISWAALIQFDQTATASGTLTYDGAGGALFGSGITFNLVSGTGTPLHDGSVLGCVGCVMPFQTGTNVFESGLAYVWNGGGSLSISGQVWDGGTLVASGVLASGSFESANALFTADTFSATFTGLGVDEKNADLIAYYGLFNPFVFAESQLALASAGIGGCDQDAGDLSFSCLVTNADFDNSTTKDPRDIPAPATLALFGLGLLGIGVTRRKRKA